MPHAIAVTSRRTGKSFWFDLDNLDRTFLFDMIREGLRQALDDVPIDVDKASDIEQELQYQQKVYLQIKNNIYGKEFTATKAQRDLIQEFKIQHPDKAAKIGDELKDLWLGYQSLRKAEKLICLQEISEKNAKTEKAIEQEKKTEDFFAQFIKEEKEKEKEEIV